MNRSLLNQRYVPLRKLAEGGMGEIFLARQTGLAGFQREVVLKLLHRRLSDHPKAVEMFLDEARLAASLCHSNIVQIFDVGEEEGGYFIVMERVHGASLRVLAETTSRLGQMIPIESSINLIIQVLEGLRYAHNYRDETGRPLKIVHRDICPSNLLVTFDGVVKIVDFGIARAESQLRSETGLRPGKFAYMAPEMVVGEPVDARADLYGVGILLYELTVGQRLIRAASFEALSRVVNDPIPPPTFARAGYPVDLEILVMRALERDPADRFASAEEMLEELEQFAFSTGLRISRLRLGKLVGKTMGRHESALSLDLPAQGDEGAADAGGDDLDFDRASLFDRSSPGADVADAADAAESITGVHDPGSVGLPPAAREGAERVRHVMEAVQQANEAIAELVAASGLEDEAEEGRTIEMRAGQQAALRADTVGPEGEISEPEIPAPESVTQVVSAEQIEAEEPLRDGSALVVTDELVEEEEELDPGHDLLREPLASTPELVVAVPTAPPAPPAPAAAQPTPAAPVPPPLATPPSPTPPLPPAASTDLLEALADISAELRAAEESDRRREEALSQAIELFGDATIVPPGKLAPVTVREPAPTPAPALVAIISPPVPPARADQTGPPPPTPDSRPAGPPADELEAADGDRRAPDELELSDLRRVPSRAAEEPELEADGETIVLQPEESSVELVLESVGGEGAQGASPPPTPPALEKSSPADADALEKTSPADADALEKTSPADADALEKTSPAAAEDPEAPAEGAEPPAARAAEPPTDPAPAPAEQEVDQEGLDAPTLTDSPRQPGASAQGEARKKAPKRKRRRRR